MLTRWRLVKAPTARDAQRYKLQLNADDLELLSIIRKLPGSCGRPFPCKDEGFNWEFHIYSVDEETRKSVEKILESIAGPQYSAAAQQPPAPPFTAVPATTINVDIKNREEKHTIEVNIPPASRPAVSNIITQVDPKVVEELKVIKNKHTEFTKELTQRQKEIDELKQKLSEKDDVLIKQVKSEKENIDSQSVEQKQKLEQEREQLRTNISQQEDELHGLKKLLEEKMVALEQDKKNQEEMMAKIKQERDRTMAELKDEYQAQVQKLMAEKQQVETQARAQVQAQIQQLQTQQQQLEHAQAQAQVDAARVQIRQAQQQQQQLQQQKLKPKTTSTTPLPQDDDPFWSLQLNQRYTFDEFIVGPNNRFTHAAGMAVAENPGKIYNPLFIYGGVGLGKTHLMQAIAHYVKKRIPETRIMYVTTEKFTGEVIEAIRRGKLQEFRDHYRMLDLLLVDDVQFLATSESTQEEFFHTFNILYENGKQIVLTSDRPPKMLQSLEDRIRSRFEWGLIADIKSPNLETRVAILKKKGESENLNLEDNILLYIASKLKSNIRELEGCLKRISAYATLTGQEVNMELVKSVVKDLIPDDEEELMLKQQAGHTPLPQYPPQSVQVPRQVTPIPQVYNIPQAPQGQGVVSIAPELRQQQPPLPPQQQPVAQPPQVPTSVQHVVAPGIPYNLTPGQPQPVPQQQVPPPPPPPPVKPIPQMKPMPMMTQQPQQASRSSGVSNVVEVAYFYPEKKEKEYETVRNKFSDVIKKHKLKLALECIFERAYPVVGKINYAFFIELCKTNKVKVAIVLGPPPDVEMNVTDFSNLLAAMMEDEGISLQFMPFNELGKEYKYLNLALDITLIKHRELTK